MHGRNKNLRDVGACRFAREHAGSPTRYILRIANRKRDTHAWTNLLLFEVTLSQGCASVRRSPHCYSQGSQAKIITNDNEYEARFARIW